MRRTLAVAAVVVATGVFVSAPARAQERFGSKGTAAFSADRLFGLGLHHQGTRVANNVDRTVDTTDFGLGWRMSQLDPFEVPRLSFDYFVIHGLDIGGSIAISTVRGDVDSTSFLFAPRIGYVWMFSKVFGFWLRGGVTYDSVATPGPAGEWGFGLTAEGMFMISPVRHFGFVLGPTLDVTLVGKYTNGDGRSADRHYRDFGIFNAGLVGWL